MYIKMLLFSCTICGKEKLENMHVPSFSKAPIDIHTPSGLKPLGISYS